MIPCTNFMHSVNKCTNDMYHLCPSWISQSDRIHLLIKFVERKIIMKKLSCCLFILSYFLILGINHLFAQNPLILDQFTADPSARVFEGKVYVYPSHDVKSKTNWFCMKDYHVFSSENLADWTDYGVIISQESVPWVDSTFNSLWAPDCIERNGKYYFYFPAIARNQPIRRGMTIGVAVSDKPYGPFKPEPKPIDGAFGIDPNPFIDKDGQAYLTWAAMHHLFIAKLKKNMLELASEPQAIEGLPEGFKEGPYLFERNGIYYFTFPYVIKKTEAIAYAMADNPMGPFTYKGVIMDESPTGCWTNHQSIIEYKDQWFLFYHHNDLSPNFDKNRSMRADSLFFNEDGTIRKVIPTLRGVGLTDATREIQIDRYSAISKKGASIDFLDKRDKFQGWKTILKKKNAWIKYNSVDFGKKNLKSVNVKTASKTGGVIELRIDEKDGPVIARIDIPKNKDWSVVNTVSGEISSGIHNLIAVLSKGKTVEIDWIQFE